MYNSTNGSLLIAMLAHLGHNLAASLVRAPGPQHLTVALLYFVVALVVVLLTEPRTLRRRIGRATEAGRGEAARS
jgi:hypothetical protein